MKKTKLHKEMIAALDAEDRSLVQSLLDQLPAGWQDDEGHTVLHYAAIWGDAELAQALLQKGADPWHKDAEGQTAHDMARAMGHVSLSTLFSETAATRGPTADFVMPGSCKTLSDIRQQPHNYFVEAARKGAFSRVAACATPTDGLKADDLLQVVKPGSDTLLHLLCETGQLGAVMLPALWQSQPDDLSKIWSELPQHYRQGINIEQITSSIRQLRLQARQIPRLKNPEF